MRTHAISHELPCISHVSHMHLLLSLMRLPCISRHLDEDAHVRHEQLAQHKGKGKGRGGVVAAEPQQFLRLQQVEGGAVTGAGGGRHVESSASPTAAAASSAPSPTRSQRNAAIASLKRMPSMKDHHRKERSHMLSRVEFLVALVKIAVNRFVLTKEMDDVSQAVDRLLGVVITSRLSAEVVLEPDAFRRGYAYSEPVCAALRRNEPLLRHAFGFLLAHGKKEGTQLPGLYGHPPVISLETWMSGLAALELIGDDLSSRDALRCFGWSRMAVTDYMSQQGNWKDSVLPFEGFMEACCRMAALKALPSTVQIQKSGADNAGEHLAKLRDGDGPAYSAFLCAQRHAWGTEVPSEFEVCVERTLSIWQVALGGAGL